MTAATTGQVTEPGAGRRRAWWMFPLVLAIVALLALLAYGIRLRGQAQVDEGPAPPFVLKTFQGREISLEALRGTPVVLNIWASWCVPCRDEAPLLEQVWREHDGAIMVLGVDYVDTEPEALAFIEEFGLTYPNGPDLGSRISDAYRVRGVPETFFIGADGVVKGVKIGPIESRAEFESYLARIKP